MLSYAADHNVRLGPTGLRVCDAVATAFMEGCVGGIPPVPVGLVTKETEEDARKGLWVVRETPPGLVVNITRQHVDDGELWTLYVVSTRDGEPL